MHVHCLWCSALNRMQCSTASCCQACICPHCRCQSWSRLLLCALVHSRLLHPTTYSRCVVTTGQHFIYCFAPFALHLLHYNCHPGDIAKALCVEAQDAKSSAYAMRMSALDGNLRILLVYISLHCIILYSYNIDFPRDHAIARCHTICMITTRSIGARTCWHRHGG